MGRDAGDRDVLVRFRGMWYWKGDLQPIVVDFIVREPSNSRAKSRAYPVIFFFYILTFLFLFKNQKQTRAQQQQQRQKEGRFIASTSRTVHQSSVVVKASEDDIDLDDIAQAIEELAKENEGFAWFGREEAEEETEEEAEATMTATAVATLPKPAATAAPATTPDDADPVKPASSGAVSAFGVPELTEDQRDTEDSSSAVGEAA